MEPRSAQRVLIAVDTNVLLEMADEIEDVVEAFDLIQAPVPTRQFVMPPTVVHELAFEPGTPRRRSCDSAASGRFRKPATTTSAPSMKFAAAGSRK